MIVFGWSDKHVRTDGVTSIECDDGIRILCSCNGASLGRRDVLAAQCRLAETLASFVPAVSGSDLRENEIKSWTTDHRTQILERLTELRGATQITIRAAAMINEPHTGTNWLRARAEQHGKLQAWQEQTILMLSQISSEQGLRTFKSKCFRSGVSFSVLTQCSSVKDNISYLHKAVQSAKIPREGRCVIVGPLPAFSFSSFDRAA